MSKEGRIYVIPLLLSQRTPKKRLLSERRNERLYLNQNFIPFKFCLFFPRTLGGSGFFSHCTSEPSKLLFLYFCSLSQQKHCQYITAAHQLFRTCTHAGTHTHTQEAETSVALVPLLFSVWKRILSAYVHYTLLYLHHSIFFLDQCANT